MFAQQQLHVFQQPDSLDFHSYIPGCGYASQTQLRSTASLVQSQMRSRLAARRFSRKGCLPRLTAGCRCRGAPTALANETVQHKTTPDQMKPAAGLGCLFGWMLFAHFSHKQQFIRQKLPASLQQNLRAGSAPRCSHNDSPGERFPHPKGGISPRLIAPEGAAAGGISPLGIRGL